MLTTRTALKFSILFFVIFCRGALLILIYCLFIVQLWRLYHPYDTVQVNLYLIAQKMLRVMVYILCKNFMLCIVYEYLRLLGHQCLLLCELLVLLVTSQSECVCHILTVIFPGEIFVKFFF
jgi:hypothetical protein